MAAVVAEQRGNFWERVPGFCYAAGFYIVILTLVCAPLLWGAARPWGWYPMQLGLFTAFACYAIGLALSDPAYKAHSNPPWTVVAALVTFLLFVLAQTVPIPQILASLLFPGTLQYYSFVPGSVPSISVDRGATLEQFLLYASYVAAFLVIYTGLKNRGRVLVLIYGLVAVALAEAVFGIYAMYQQVFVVPKDILDGHFRVARGTYVNPNHYAGYLMTVGALVMGMIYAGLAERWGGVQRISFADVVAELGTSTGVWLAILAVIITAALFSGSRGAPLAMVLAFVALLSLGSFNGRKTDLRILLPILALLVTAVLWLGAGEFVTKMFGEGLAISSRLHMWSLNLEAIQDHWLFGSGAGTFPLIFSAVRDGSLRPLRFDSPHNDYMETLTEVGVIGGVVLLVFVVTVLYRILKAYLQRRDPFYRGILFGTAIAMIGFMVHSIVEFNFRIPANALLFFAVSALGLRATTLSKRRQT